jgi:ribonuclease G
MSKEMVISTTPHETRVAILEEGQLCEIYVEREREFALVGSIYKGRVTRVLPGMQSAFVEIGLDSDAFLYVTDFLQDIEDIDQVVSTVEEKVDGKVQRIENEGGRVFSADAAGGSVEPVEVEPAGPMGADADNAENEVNGNVAPPGERSSGPSGSSGSESGLTTLPSEHISGNLGGGGSSSGSTAGPSGGFGGGQRGPGGSGGPRFGRPYEGRGDRDRGGRGGGRFSGRGGGRRGRPDRSGGGGGGGRDRGRFGNSLPHSKYASSRPYDPDPTTAETATSGDYVPVMLPGETLARVKPGAGTQTPETGMSHEAGTARVDEHAGAGAGDHEARETQAPSHTANSTEQSFVVGSGDPLDIPSVDSFTSGFDTEHVEAAAEERGGETDTSTGDELSEEEAISLAEQVAEAQLEESVRQTDGQELSGSGIAYTEAEHDEAGDESATEEREEREEEDEELLVDETDHEEGEDDTDEPNDPVRAAADEEVGLGSSTEAESESEADTHNLRAGSEVSETGSEDEQGDVNGNVAPSDANQPGNNWTVLEGEHLGGNLGQPGSEGQPEATARVQRDFRARMPHPARRGGGRDRGGRDRGGRGGRDRGGDRGDRGDRGRGPQRFQRGPSAHRHQQQRRPSLISDLLKQGQEIIVQIAKEPLGKKGARITSHVALPGRYLVYMPTLDHTGVSRKIASAEERARLRQLVNSAKGESGGGFIVRTAASHAAPDEVRADVEFLTKTWAEIKSRSEQRKAPSLLHRDLNLVERILRDYLNPDYSAIWVDSEEEYTKVVDFVSRFQPQLVSRVKLYTKETPVYEEFGIQQEIDKGLRPKVWLKSGGYIVINHTEALVAIDVNTGKFVGKGSNRLEDTIVRTNLEAVKEVVRQMRLRDLGGIIIIDFIDMEERRNREKVMAALEDALKADRAPSKVLRFNEFGLVAITRKRTKQALERTLCQPCPYCTGSGMVKSIPTLCYEIQAEARKMAPEIESGSLTLRVHPEIAKALKTRESTLMEELEGWVKKSVIIQSDPALHWEQYDIF